MFFKVKLTRIETIVLVSSFVGTVILIAGSLNGSKGFENYDLDKTTLIALILLLFVPVILGSSSVMLRKMRNLGEYTIGSYITISLALTYMPYLYISRQGFNYI